MKIFLPGTLFLLVTICGYAQPDTAKISQRALFFADSLVKTDAFGNWSTYADLNPASVVKYYGGKDGFIEHVKLFRTRTTSELEEAAPELKVLTLLTQDQQWQCVIQMTRTYHKGDKTFHLKTYFIGQSRDEGETWKMFDVYYNKVANIIYMFPEVFGDMAIQEATVMTPEQELAAQQKASSGAGAAPKTVAKKK